MPVKACPGLDPGRAFSFACGFSNLNIAWIPDLDLGPLAEPLDRFGIFKWGLVVVENRDFHS